MAGEYRESARRIIECLGGRDNIVSIYHCMTRLRLIVVDHKKIDIDELDLVSLVKGSYIREGQVHVILGVGTVDRVYDEILLISNMKPVSDKEFEEEFEKKQAPFVKLVKIIGDIFIPILPAMIASGMLFGLLNSMSYIWPAIKEYDWFQMLELISETVIKYLPVLVACSSAQRFGGNPYLAGGIGLILMHRELFQGWDLLRHANVPYWQIGGLKIYQMAYEGHVIPIIISIWFMSKLERWLHKHVPEIADIFITPLITLLVTATMTLAFIGPVLMVMEQWVIRLARFVLEIPYGIGAALCAAFFPMSVVLGIQHMFMVLEIQFLAETGQNIWVRVCSSANIAMCISCLTVALKTKSERLKGISFPAGISAALGVTEPAIFGINFRYHTPLICGMIGSGVGAGVGAMLGVYGTAYGVSALPGIILSTPCLWQYLVMLLVTAVVTFSLTWFFWKDEKYLKDSLPKGKKERIERAEDISKTESESTLIHSPIQGKVIKREEIPDPTFAEGYLGEGIGIIPDSGDVIAPFDGKVLTITPTRHAMILEGPSGENLLIHIGIDTVELDGGDFEIYVSEGERIHLGQKIMFFDLNHLLSLNYNITSGVFVVNKDDFSHLSMKSLEYTSFGEMLMELQK